MVIANDNQPDGRASVADDKAGGSRPYVGTRQGARTYVGTHQGSRTYTGSGPAAERVGAEIIAKVTDDIGERIVVRIGEAVILGPLMDSVLEELRAKRANEG